MNTMTSIERLVVRGLAQLFFIYMLLCVAFKESFYRIGIGGVTISEMVVILTILYGLFFRPYVFLDFLFKDKAILFFILALVYLVYSFLHDERQAYYILRQSAPVMYFLFLPVAGFVLCNYLYQIQNYTRYVITLSILLSAALLSSTIIKGGNIDGAIILAMLLFLISSITTVESYLTKICLISITLLSAVMANHAGHTLAMLLFFFAVFLNEIRKYIVPFLLLAAVALLLSLPIILNISEIADANALWRYYYWTDVTSYLFDKGFWLVGDGYGIEYINREFEHFFVLVSQIGTLEGYQYRILTTPTHNSFLNIFYHLGLPGLIFISAFLFKLSVRVYSYGQFVDLGLLIAVSAIMFTHNAIELPYMASPIMISVGFIYWKNVRV